MPKTTRDLAPAPARPPAAPAEAKILRSSDPRLNGRRPADVARELSQQLADLVAIIDRVSQGILMDVHDMNAWRDDHRIEVIEDEADEEDVTSTGPLMKLYDDLAVLRAQVLQHVAIGAGDVNALGRAACDDYQRFDLVAQETSNVTTLFQERLQHDSDRLRRTLAGVNLTKDLSFAGAAAVAVVVAAPAAAAYGLEGSALALGQAGAGTLGGALVLGGLHAVDVADPRSLTDRTVAGTEEGALMGASGPTGEAAGVVAKETVGRFAGDSALGRTVTSAAVGAADTAVASGTYAAGATLANDGSVSAAVGAGATAAGIGAPFGALLGIAMREPEPAAIPQPKPLPSNPAEAKALLDAGLEYDEIEIRAYYLAQISKVDELDPIWINEGKTVEQRARAAYEIRHNARITARAMDSDLNRVQKQRARDIVKYGNPDGPTFDELVAKATSSGLVGDAVYEEIVGSSRRTDAATNARVGLRGNSSRSGEENKQ
jgi:hypothetical protein